MKKKCQTEQTCEDRNKNKNKKKKKKKIRVSRQQHHAYVDPCPENPKNAETEQNFRTTILIP